MPCSHVLPAVGGASGPQTTNGGQASLRPCQPTNGGGVVFCACPAKELPELSLGSRCTQACVFSALWPLLASLPPALQEKHVLKKVALPLGVCPPVPCRSQSFQLEDARSLGERGARGPFCSSAPAVGGGRRARCFKGLVTGRRPPREAWEGPATLAAGTKASQTR